MGSHQRMVPIGCWVQRSCRYQIVIPHVNVNGIVSRGRRAPQFLCTKVHAVAVLVFLTRFMVIGIWKRKYAVIAVDATEFVSDISG